MCKAICFPRSFLVCMRYWTLKIYYCLISFTHSLLFVVSILFLILNFFSHCLFIVVSRPRLYLTSHGQCSGLAVSEGWWNDSARADWSSVWRGEAHRMNSYHSGTHRCHNHRHHYHNGIFIIIIIIIITNIRIPLAPRRIRSARVADRYTGVTARSSALYPVFALLWFL